MRKSRKKVGDLGLALELRRDREARHREADYYAKRLAKTDADIADLVVRYRDSGAGITAICEAYGTKDRHTVLDILHAADKEAEGGDAS